MEQYIDYLNQQDFEITYSHIVSAWDDKIIYAKGKYLLKLWIAFKAIIIRTFDWLRCSNFDVIIIYREANFLGNVFFEKRFAASKVPVVFDFDDAIWLNDVSEGNSNLSWLKKPEKTGKIIALCNLVIAGNKYLADYAHIFNENTIIIPTSINTDYHQQKITKKNGSVCIGWTGSSTTIKHFQEAVSFLIKIKQKYGDKVNFKVIVDIDYQNTELDLTSTLWTAETEIEELNKIDIGIMPLPDDQWSKGKCGFKGIQYMALGKPTIMSPVGVNTEIIEENKNGFLASSDDEWVEKLSLLIESEELRNSIGKEGEKTIVEKYSVNIQKNVLVDSLDNLIT